MMKKSCFGLLLLLSTAAFAMPRVDPDVGSFLKIGTGYDMISGQPMANCIISQTAKPVSAGTAEVAAHLHYITDYDSLAKALEITASANLKLGMPAFQSTLNAKTRFFSQQKVEEESIYFMVDISVKWPMEKIEDIYLKDHYKELLSASDGIERFRVTCGDEFVDSVQRGAHMYGLVKIKTSTRDEKKSLEVAINGKVGETFSTSMALKQTLTSIVKSHNYELFYHQVGGPAINIPLSLENFDELFNQATTFAKRVDQSKTGTIIMASTAPYFQTANFPRGVSRIRLDHQINVVEQLSKHRYNTLKKLTYLNAIVDNREDFEKITEKQFSEINKARDQYIQNLSIISNLADECFYDITECREPKSSDGFLTPSYTTVKKISGTPLPVVVPPTPPEVKKPKVCEEWLYREGNTSVCPFLQYTEGRHEIACGGTETEFQPDLINETEADIQVWEQVHAWILAQSEICKSRGYQRAEIKATHRGVQEGMGNHWTDIITRRVTCVRGKLCRHPHFGTEYQTCRHESFGKELCLRWSDGTSDRLPLNQK